MPPPFYKCALEAKFEDEIDGLQKWPFLVLFFTLFGAVFFIVTHIYEQTKYILQKKNCPQMSLPGCREALNILHPPFEGSPPPTQLTNPSHKSQLSRAIN